MRLDIKVTPKLIAAIDREAKKQQIPASRVAGKILAEALGLDVNEALPPFKMPGRPRKILASA